MEFTRDEVRDMANRLAAIRHLKEGIPLPKLPANITTKTELRVECGECEWHLARDPECPSTNEYEIRLMGHMLEAELMLASMKLRKEDPFLFAILGIAGA